MAKDLEATLQKLRTHLAASNRFAEVTIGEPFNAPEGLHCAVFLGPNWRVPQVTLNGSVEERELTLRIYRDAVADNREETEILLSRVVAEVLEDIFGDAELNNPADGSTNLRAALPTKTTVRFGYQEVRQKLMRIVDIVLTLQVDDSFALAS